MHAMIYKKLLNGALSRLQFIFRQTSDKTKQRDIWFVNYAQPESVNHFMSVQQILSAENKRAFFYYFFALAIADNLFDNAAL